MKKLQFKRIVTSVAIQEGAMLPRFYGIYKYDFEKNCKLCCPMPFHIPILLYSWVMSGVRGFMWSVVMNPRNAYAQGHKNGYNLAASMYEGLLTDLTDSNMKMYKSIRQCRNDLNQIRKSLR